MPSDMPTSPPSAAVRVAAVQMVSGPDVTANLAAAEALVERAAADGARLVLTPEYFCLMGLEETAKLRAAEADGDGPVQRWLAATARRLGIWLIGGSVPLASPVPGKVWNSLLVHAPDGTRAARYDKIHLFGFESGHERFAESRTITPGDTPRVVDTEIGRVGLSICYDLRFPELYRGFGTVDLIVVPSAFTQTTGRAHWEPLLRARAIENQCWVLAAAQGGTHPSGRTTHGHSMLIDPWGVIVDCLPEGPGVVGGALDPARLASVRARLPALEHRRPDPICPTGRVAVAASPAHLALDPVTSSA
jgi:nitrilase